MLEGLSPSWSPWGVWPTGKHCETVLILSNLFLGGWRGSFEVREHIVSGMFFQIKGQYLKQVKWTHAFPLELRPLGSSSY